MDLARYRFDLSIEEVPTSWYNILPDLPEEVPPPLNPKTGEPVDPSALAKLFPKALIEQEVSRERYIEIPGEVREAYISFARRPTPLLRAVNLERALDTPAEIYYKYEGVTPTGSHKINTALAQAYYNKLEGVERLVTETGAGQWGSALSAAGAYFGMKVRVYMVRVSYLQKPYRRTLMELYGAEVYPSPSDKTEFGRKLLAENPNHPGSLGIAISEAIEDVINSGGNARYSLGSVLNHVLLHQTVIGLEAEKQFREAGVYPDIMIGAVGGGSNFAGFTYPFIRHRLKGSSSTRFIAVEPKASPSMTRGVYTYDYGDTAGLTPLLKMHTLGHTYQVPPIHAGGLRYHGVAPTLSVLLKHGIVEARAYHQREVFRAAHLFAKAEGIVPAPESAHAVKAAIDEAIKARDEGRRMVIAFNLSGHGLLDLQGYREYLDGTLEDYEPEEIPASRR
ncbi:tryptophan synthase beta chain 2 [Aeropyrum pernix]|uniref:Tryptophan synthase beta chain n=1 Tax=Aeropyrum pernix TaxID=56636 RepID=A0A401H791_AERPX|nr:TrpB-like pyridoxal phosphate-dependent enzyme [Aeropyrum pernix]GBF08337.1 tryptophan synthase beta chain 2 [Aeropyrum pernix]